MVMILDAISETEAGFLYHKIVFTMNNSLHFYCMGQFTDGTQSIEQTMLKMLKTLVSNKGLTGYYTSA